MKGVFIEVADVIQMKAIFVVIFQMKGAFFEVKGIFQLKAVFIEVGVVHFKDVFIEGDCYRDERCFH